MYPLAGGGQWPVTRPEHDGTLQPAWRSIDFRLPRNDERGRATPVARNVPLRRQQLGARSRRHLPSRAHHWRPWHGSPLPQDRGALVSQPQLNHPVESLRLGWRGKPARTPTVQVGDAGPNRRIVRYDILGPCQYHVAVLGPPARMHRGPAAEVQIYYEHGGLGLHVHVSPPSRSNFSSILKLFTLYTTFNISLIYV
jgi:hypothetical protein